MKVWRLERTDGDRLGVWRSDDCDRARSMLSFHDQDLDQHNPNRKPTVWGDNMLYLKSDYITRNHFCAFKDVEQYQEWFSAKMRKALDKTPTKLVLYDISKKKGDVIFGEWQVLFKRAKAKILKELKPSTPKSVLKKFEA